MPPRPGDLVRIVSLEGNTWTVRDRAGWLVGHRASVASVAWDGRWADLKVHLTAFSPSGQANWRLRTSGLRALDPAAPDETTREPMRGEIRAGDRAVIVELSQSPTWTHTLRGALLGSSGTVLRVHPKDHLLLLELDPEETSPALPGTRRWTLHRDDLRFVSDRPAPHQRTSPYQVGLERRGLRVIRHALPARRRTAALCGTAVRPTMIGTWSPFITEPFGTCSACVRLTTPPPPC